MTETGDRKLALLCSVKCPGKLILDAYDTCRRLRDTAVTVVSGFHSPMEQECLRILLRSRNKVIWCLARGKRSRIPPAFKESVAAGRLQIIAPFPDKVRRLTAVTCAKRNRLVADMTDAVLVVHHQNPGTISGTHSAPNNSSATLKSCLPVTGLSMKRSSLVQDRRPPAS